MMMSPFNPRSERHVQHLDLDTRDPLEKWHEHISLLVRVGLGLLAVAGLYYRLDARLELLEFRIAQNERHIEQHTTVDERLQTEVDEILRFEASEANSNSHQRPSDSQEQRDPAIIDRRRRGQ